MTGSTAEASGKRIKFENPPVTELGISLYHLPVQELRAQHIGLYWERIRQRFPLCEQQSPVVTPGDAQIFQDMPNEVFPLPRFWFSSSQHPTLIQIQRNAFMLNWRRIGEGDYPHYEAVRDDFWQEFERYKRFIEETVDGKIGVLHRCELVYVNLFQEDVGYTTPSQLAHILPSTASIYELQTNDRQVADMNATITFRVNPTLLIDMAIRVGKRLDTREPLAMLELKARGAPPDLSIDGARAWYETAHDTTYHLFLDATNKTVQKTIWRPR